MNEKAMELFGNEEFLKKLEKMDDIEEVKKTLADEGIELDFDAMKAVVSAGDIEFSERELEDVSGGGIVKSAWNLGKAIGIVGRTLYDDAKGNSRSYSNKDVMWAIGLIDSYNPFK